MAKLSLSPISSRYASVAALNANFDAIETALENTLSRDGTTPNELSADLDANNQSILNLRDATSANEAVPYGQLTDLLTVYAGDAFISQRQSFVATNNQTVFNFTTLTYVQGINNLNVYVNGSKQIVNVNYVETSPTSITFVSGLNNGDVVECLSNQPTTTIDGGDAATVQYVPAGGSAVTTTVQTKLRESVSVKDFGAVGDGVTNDTAAIQAAIDAVWSAGGGEVFVPSGLYKITSDIYLKRFVTLRGPEMYIGPNSLYSVASVEGGVDGFAVFVPSNAITSAAVIFDFALADKTSRPYGAKLINLLVDCDAVTGNKDGVYVNKIPVGEGPFNSGFASNVNEVINVSVINSPRYGFNVTSNGSTQNINLMISGCRAAFCAKHGFYFEKAYDMLLEHSFGFANNGSGLYTSNCATARILNCDFFNNGQYGNTGAVGGGNGITDDSTDMRYVGCHVDNNYRHGIEFVSVSNTTKNKMTRVVDCRISSNGGDDNTGAYDNVKIGDVSGNSIYGIAFVACKNGGSPHNANSSARVGYQINQTTISNQNANQIVGCQFSASDLASSANVLSAYAWQQSIISGTYSVDGNALSNKPYSIPAWTGDASVSVLVGANFYITANVGAARISGIVAGTTDNAIGREVWILINDANTGVDFTFTNLKGNGGVDLAAGAGTVGKLLHCKNYDGTKWAIQIYG